MRRLLGCAVLALSVPMLAMRAASQESGEEEKPAEAAKPDLGSMRTIEFDVDRGTWMNLDVSPDGGTIVFDMLGDLYTLPIGGGDATPLVTGRDWDQMPRYSPDAQSIAFISDRDGNHNLWIMDADGSDPRQVTKERTASIGSPTWTPDGEYVLVRKAGFGITSPSLWMVHKDGGSGFEVVSGFQQSAGPEFAPDGSAVYFSTRTFGPSGGTRATAWQIRRKAWPSGEVVQVTSSNRGGFRPKLSPDGRWLAYGQGRDAGTTLRLRELSTGAERELLTAITRDDSEGFSSQDVLPHYAFTPDSSAVVITLGGRIAKVALADAAVTLIPFTVHVVQQVPEPVRVESRVAEGDVQARMLRWTSISADGKQAVFSALGKIYSATLPGGAPRRLTDRSEREYFPTFSPDGRRVAYVSWSDAAGGHVMVAAADGATPPRAVTTVAGRYTSVAWSPDGANLAFVRGTGVEQRESQPDDESYLEVAWVPASGGDVRAIATFTPPIYFLRHYPTLTFSPDGSRVYFTEAVLGAGRPQGQLRSVRLDGFDAKVHVTFRTADEAVPSPDGKRVAVIRRDEVWVMPLPAFARTAPPAETPFEVMLDSPPVPARRLSTGGASYVAWRGNDELLWSFTNRIFRQRIDAADNADPEMVAEIDLRVPRVVGAGTLAFRNARIVTMRGDEVFDRGTIVVHGDRIQAVGRAADVRIPEGATVIDARGTTIMPGIIDVHAHMHYSYPETYPQQRWEYIANLAYGVTTAYDPSAYSLDVFAEAEMVEAGELWGPRIYSSGDVMLGSEDSPGYVDIKGIEDARLAVKRHVDYGSLMLKSYMQPRRDQRQWLAQAAREAGVRITAEGGSDLALDLSLVADGYTAFEHSLPIAPLYDDVAQFIGRSGTHYTPTLIVAYGGPSSESYFARAGAHDDPKLRRFTPETSLDRYRRLTLIPDDEWHFDDVAAAAAAIVRAGGFVDLGAHGNRQGLGAHWELWAFGVGGFTPMEALRAATVVPARKLGLEQDLGSLEAGKLADLLVLEANPLEDLRNSEKLRYVVKGGIVWDAASMTRLYPTRQAPAPFFWQTDADRARFAAPEPPPFGGSQRRGSQ